MFVCRVWSDKQQAKLCFHLIESHKATNIPGCWSGETPSSPWASHLRAGALPLTTPPGSSTLGVHSVGLGHAGIWVCSPNTASFLGQLPPPWKRANSSSPREGPPLPSVSAHSKDVLNCRGGRDAQLTESPSCPKTSSKRFKRAHKTYREIIRANSWLPTRSKEPSYEIPTILEREKNWQPQVPVLLSQARSAH